LAIEDHSYYITREWSVGLGGRYWGM